MNFDYTFITLFGFKIFEPMIILTNLPIFIIGLYSFKKLIRLKNIYSKNYAWFVLLVGISSCFGSLAHAVHFQNGKLFFDIIFYIMNALSLVSAYFCFKFGYIYFLGNDLKPNFLVLTISKIWILTMLVYAFFYNNFLMIKINAAIVLIYSFIIHFIKYNKLNERGSGLVVFGIGISFISIITHTLKISINEWFNYKDISHVIISISLLIIYKGVNVNSKKQEIAT